MSVANGTASQWEEIKHIFESFKVGVPAFLDEKEKYEKILNETLTENAFLNFCDQVEEHAFSVDYSGGLLDRLGACFVEHFSQAQKRRELNFFKLGQLFFCIEKRTIYRGKGLNKKKVGNRVCAVNRFTRKRSQKAKFFYPPFYHPWGTGEERAELIRAKHQAV